jgi:hypothetical protein
VPITISIDVDSAAVMGSLEVLPALVDGELAKAMVLSTFLVEGEVKSLTPRKTGRLFSAWQSSVHGYTGRVSNNVSYAGYVERGTAPHDIVARGDALRFTIGGVTYFRKKVRHPGFAGRHMAQLAGTNSKPAVIEIFRNAIRDAARAAQGK